MEIEKLREHNEFVKKLALKKGAADVVVAAVVKNKDQIKFSNNKISIIQKWSEANQSLFMVKDGRVVTTTIKDFDKKTTEETVDKLIKFAKSLPKNSEYLGIAEGPFSYTETKNGFDKKASELNERAVSYVEKGISAAISAGAVRSSGVLEIGTTEEVMATSNKVEARTKATNIYFSIRAFASKEASGHQVCNSRMLSDLDVKACAEEAAEIAKLAMNPVQGKGGKYDLLFYPLPFSNLIDVVGNSASVFLVEAGLSFFNNSVGKKVASSNFSLTDDPTAEGGYASVPFDEEGVPTRINKIIEKGVLKTYLHNTSTAKKYKTKTTANAGLMSPRPFNLVVGKGNINKDEMITDLKRGVVITNIWYTRFQNYSKGDFSTIPRDGAFLVENGKIIKSLKGMRISDNMISLLKNFKAASKQARWVAGWENENAVLCPHAIIKGVRITKATDTMQQNGL